LSHLFFRFPLSLFVLLEQCLLIGQLLAQYLKSSLQIQLVDGYLCDLASQSKENVRSYTCHE